MNEQAARLLVLTRSGGRCELAIPGVCLGVAGTVHHRLKRSAGGPWSPSNLLRACGSGTTGCHGWTEAHPADAQAAGTWLLRGEDPAVEPVIMAPGHLWRAWWLLDEEGIYRWVAEPDVDREQARYAVLALLA